MSYSLISHYAKLLTCACLVMGITGCMGKTGTNSQLSQGPTVAAASAVESEPVQNTAPTIAGAPAAQAMEGESYWFRPQAADPDGDTLVFSIQNRPAWANFNRGNGILSGSPQTGDAGVYRGIVISVSDGVESRSIGPFSVTVAAVAVVPEPDPVPPPAPPPSTGRVSHPGHYISMVRSDSQATMIDSIKPGVTGFQKRYTWASIEPTPGNYDFSAIASDLNLLAGQGMYLVVFLEDKSFDNSVPTPAYLADYTLPNRQGGYTAMRWSPYVVDRINKLIQAMGARFDGHRAFEGIAFQETAPSLTDAVLDANGYTPEKYRDAQIANLSTAAASFPTSQVFWYMNFFPEKQGYIADIAEAVAPLGVAMGGPDILPDDWTLVELAYPFYEQFNGKITLFNSMQFNSYSHEHKDPSAATKYWTMNELFRFARDQLHVSYVFWNRKTWRDPADSYNWQDALPVIGNNPAFNI